MELKHLILLEYRFKDFLLIVPYGIETRYSFNLIASTLTFNRTLWN